ncbi:MAG: hypothetical protein HUJ30_01295, partial [Gammaproteobacteria bacterium]|nr:hypothetical protein [Gammaproteobacteria bacterium]
MNALRIALLSAALSGFVTSAQAINLIDSHTGIYGVRSAYTLEQGSYAYGFWTSGEFYKAPGSTDYYSREGLAMSFHQGVTDSFEVGFYLPGQSSNGTGRLEVEHLGVSFKFKTDETPATKDAVSMTIYAGMLSADPTKGVGSGIDNYGFEFDYSNLFGSTRFHTNIGVERSDSITVTSPSAATYSVSNKLFWRLGAEFPTSESGNFNLGLEMVSDMDVGTTSAYLAPSYTYRSPDKHLQYHFGVNYNASETPDTPLAQVFMGVNYSFDSPTKQISQLEQRIIELNNRVDELITSQGAQDGALELVDTRYNYLYETVLPTYDA